MATFSDIQLPRIAVVFANNKENPGAVIHATANTRFWKSYQPVAEDICNSLRAMGLDAITMPDGIDLTERLRSEGVELVWLNTGGVQGESPMSQTPAMLEAAGVPYIGHSPLSAALLDDKGLFKLACRGLGISTAPFIIHNPTIGPLDTDSTAFLSAFGDYQGPFIVKPVTGRASQNVEFVDCLADVAAMVAQVAASTNCLVLIEQYLGGREFCIAVMGAGPAGAVAFSAVERVLAPDEQIFTSMDVKAITTDRVRVLDPVREGHLFSRLAALGTATYSSLNLGSLIRLDIRADSKGQLYVLEANPKPDLKKPSSSCTSLVCEGLTHLGLSYNDLISCLLVERLWQLQHNRPSMLAHFMPAGMRAEHLVARLPASIQKVLTQRQMPPKLPGPALCSMLLAGQKLSEQVTVTVDTAASSDQSDGVDSPCESGDSPDSLTGSQSDDDDITGSPSEDDGVMMFAVGESELAAAVVERSVSSVSLQRSCGVLVGHSAVMQLRALSLTRPSGV